MFRDCIIEYLKVYEFARFTYKAQSMLRFLDMCMTQILSPE